MPVVTIRWLAGRDAAAKQRVARRVAAALAEEGVAPAATWIVFEDVAREDWHLGDAALRGDGDDG